MSVVMTSLSIPVAGTKYVARRALAGCFDILMVSQRVEGRKMKSRGMEVHFDPGVFASKCEPGMVDGMLQSRLSDPFKSNASAGKRKPNGDIQAVRARRNTVYNTSGERLYVSRLV